MGCVGGSPVTAMSEALLRTFLLIAKAQGKFSKVSMVIAHHLVIEDL